MGFEDVKLPKFVRGWGRLVRRKGAAAAVVLLCPLGQVPFRRVVPLGRLPSDANQRAPFGVTRVEGSEGRCVDHRRETRTGVRVHGLRIANLTRVG